MCGNESGPDCTDVYAEYCAFCDCPPTITFEHLRPEPYVDKDSYPEGGSLIAIEELPWNSGDANSGYAEVRSRSQHYSWPSGKHLGFCRVSLVISFADGGTISRFCCRYRVKEDDLVVETVPDKVARVIQVNDDSLSFSSIRMFHGRTLDHDRVSINVREERCAHEIGFEYGFLSVAGPINSLKIGSTASRCLFHTEMCIEDVNLVR
jgi:hypothetical protein